MIKKIKIILSDLEGYYEEVSKAEGNYFYSQQVWGSYNDSVRELQLVSSQDYSKFIITPIDRGTVDLADFRLKINNLIKRLKIEISDNEFSATEDNNENKEVDFENNNSDKNIDNSGYNLNSFVEEIKNIYPKPGANLQLLKKYVKEIVSQLSPREQKILEMKFGLLDGVSHTLDEVGREFEISREDVRRIESKALKKIRKMNLNFKAIKILDEGQIIRIPDSKVEPILGVRELANQVSSLLIDMQNQDGSMFGIFGRWGRGKTFLMDIIKKNQLILDKFNIVDFNAWKYQETPALWSHFYRSLLSTYYDDYYSKNILGKLFFILKKTWITILTLVLFLLLLFYFSNHLKTLFNIIIVQYQELSIILGTTLGVIILKLVYIIIQNNRYLLRFYKRASNKDLVDYLGDQFNLQRRIAVFIKKWSKSSNKKVLLFVDNLDRCSHDKILEVIDSLRIVLDDEDIKKEILVIVAIDERILTKSIKNKYENLKDENLDINVLIKEYMDKLFLSGISLPDLNNQEKLEILEGLFKIKEMEDSVFNNSDSVHNINYSQKNISKNQKNDKSIELKKPVITQEESVKIGEVVMNNKMTPRQIDILRFRYLLIRYLLSINNVDWQKFNIALLIMDYSNKKNVESWDEMSTGSGDELVDKIVKMVVCY